MGWLNRLLGREEDETPKVQTREEYTGIRTEKTGGMTRGADGQAVEAVTHRLDDVKVATELGRNDLRKLGLTSGPDLSRFGSGPQVQKNTGADPVASANLGAIGEERSEVTALSRESDQEIGSRRMMHGIEIVDRILAALGSPKSFMSLNSAIKGPLIAQFIATTQADTSADKFAQLLVDQGIIEEIDIDTSHSTFEMPQITLGDEGEVKIAGTTITVLTASYQLTPKYKPKVTPREEQVNPEIKKWTCTLLEQIGITGRDQNIILTELDAIIKRPNPQLVEILAAISNGKINDKKVADDHLSKIVVMIGAKPSDEWISIKSLSGETLTVEGQAVHIKSQEADDFDFDELLGELDGLELDASSLIAISSAIQASTSGIPTLDEEIPGIDDRRGGPTTQNITTIAGPDGNNEKL
ncbi:MAG: hypothetical protein Q8P68_05945 [Candidatus Peregrinibacteria bacterium]|nr:hypothetical protein [Candidatus Peregrinibacteria bacterium]MDZ4244949.1 hypothetical protein [Candidatus Gracilibacteria bacterium]